MCVLFIMFLCLCVFLCVCVVCVWESARACVCVCVCVCVYVSVCTHSSLKVETKQSQPFLCCCIAGCTGQHEDVQLCPGFTAVRSSTVHSHHAEASSVQLPALSVSLQPGFIRKSNLSDLYTQAAEWWMQPSNLIVFRSGSLFNLHLWLCHG